jgi:hypothetical protein
MQTEAVIAYVLDACATAGGAALLSALLPSGAPASSLQLFARPLGGARSVFHVLHEGAGGGEVVVKFHGSPARAAREALVREVYAGCAGGLGSGARPAVVFADPDRGVTALARLSPHAEVRSELVAGNLFPLLPVGVADAVGAPLFHTSVWAQGCGGAPRSGPLGALRGGGVGGAAAGGRCAAAGGEALATLFAPLEGSGGAPRGCAPLGALAAAALAAAAAPGGGAAAAGVALRARLAEGAEALLHGEFTTGALMSGLVPLSAPPAVADFESMRPDEYPVTVGGGGGGTPALMGTAGGEAAARAAAAPPGAVEGQLRLLGGGGGGLGPIGFDLGCLLGSLLLAAAGAAGARRCAAAEAARGGYARYTAARAEERAAEHCAGVLATAAATWREFLSEFVGAWDGDAGRAEASVARRANADAAVEAAARGDAGAVRTDAWNGAPAAQLWRTQAAFLAGVGGDALGFAGVWLLREVVAGVPPPEVAALPERAAARGGAGAGARDAAAARAIATAHALLLVGEGWARGAAAAARRAGGRDAALAAVGTAFDAAAEAAAAVDAHMAWAALEGSAPGGAPLPAALREIAEAAAAPFANSEALAAWFAARGF